MLYLTGSARWRKWAGLTALTLLTFIHSQSAGAAGAASGAAMIRDITPGAASSTISNMVGAAEKVFFTLGDAASARLMATDGTTAGTGQLISTAAGDGPKAASVLTEAKTRLYFSAGDDLHGIEPWVSDGTSAGTRMIEDVTPGTASSFISGMVSLDEELFFLLNVNGPNGASELWKSDGTAAGTALVKNFGAFTGFNGSQQMFVWNIFVFFTISDAAGNRQLCVSNGTAAGTGVLANFNEPAGATPQSPAATGSYLYFTGTSNAGGIEPWRTDGTVNGTAMIKDLVAGGSSSLPASPALLENGTLLFTASDAQSNRRLWKTDGTAAGTVLAQTGGTIATNPLFPTSLGAKAVFQSDNGLWASDGTSAGTAKFIAAAMNAPAIPRGFARVSDVLFYFGADAQHGSELWMTDGTAGGTKIVRDINPGTASSAPSGAATPQPVALGDTLIFVANDGAHGLELWHTIPAHSAADDAWLMLQ